MLLKGRTTHGLAADVARLCSSTRLAVLKRGGVGGGALCRAYGHRQNALGAAAAGTAGLPDGGRYLRDPVRPDLI